MTLRYRLHKIIRLGFRLALAGLFLYSGITALQNPTRQLNAWLHPSAIDFIQTLIEPTLFMSIVAVVSIILAVSIASGFLIKYSLSLASLLLLVTVINYAVFAGINVITKEFLRDLVVLMGTLYLFAEEL